MATKIRRRRLIRPKPQTISEIWRASLGRLLGFYDRRRGSLKSFFPKLFITFMLINIACYWVAILTAFPEEMAGDERLEYLLMQFPVGFLGAVFDSASFFITIWIARRALKATSFLSYVAHLSVDVMIAIAATGWVLMVFSVSGWLVANVLPSSNKSVSLTQSSNRYESRVNQAIKRPLKRENLKNIYFGTMMGFSALIPTLIHLYLSAQATAIYSRRAIKRRRGSKRY